MLQIAVFTDGSGRNAYATKFQKALEEVCPPNSVQHLSYSAYLLKNTGLEPEEIIAKIFEKVPDIDVYGNNILIASVVYPLAVLGPPEDAVLLYQQALKDLYSQGHSKV